MSKHSKPLTYEEIYRLEDLHIELMKTINDKPTTQTQKNETELRNLILKAYRDIPEKSQEKIKLLPIKDLIGIANGLVGLYG